MTGNVREIKFSTGKMREFQDSALPGNYFSQPDSNRPEPEEE